MSESMYDRFTLLDRLSRVLAPQPRLFVFTRVEGIALDIKRDPHTHQPLIGLSGALYRRLEIKILNEQNAHLKDRTDGITIVPSPMLELVFPSPAYIADPVPNTLSEFYQSPPKGPPAHLRVTIEPKPVRQSL